MSDLRPAHEVLLSRLGEHADEILKLQELINAGGGRPGRFLETVSQLRSYQVQTIGAFCEDLDVLVSIVIPCEELEMVVTGLLAVDSLGYRHAKVWSLIETLRARIEVV
ncbi:MAG: hypothetical protein AAB840_01325 [Patescibacteria group bacterium]